MPGPVQRVDRGSVALALLGAGHVADGHLQCLGVPAAGLQCRRAGGDVGRWQLGSSGVMNGSGYSLLVEVD